MALQTHFSSYFTDKLHQSFSPILTIRSKKRSQPPSDSVPRNSGVGSGPSNRNTKRKQNRQREGASSIIRRNPVEKSALVKEQEPAQQEQGAYEPPSDSIPKNSGVGFGPSNVNTERKQKGQRDRDSIIRRNPVEKPALVKEPEPVEQEQGAYENAFILAWLGFGSVILVEGLALAASGFFPEEWDKIFVKYLYPSFTPTVFLFVAGAIAFGVVKYKQNEKLTERK